MGFSKSLIPKTKEYFQLFLHWLKQQCSPLESLDRVAWISAVSVAAVAFIIRVVMIYTVDFSTAQVSDFGNYWTLMRELAESGKLPSLSAPV